MPVRCLSAWRALPRGGEQLMLLGLVTTKAERELAAARDESAALRGRLADAEADLLRMGDAFDIQAAELAGARADLETERENGERLTDACLRYEQTLLDYEAAWDEVMNPVKDPSQVILLDPVGVPDGSRPRNGAPVSLRKLRRTASREADQAAVRRGAVKGPPKPLPATRVSAEERAAVRDALTDTASSPDEEG